MSSDIDTLRQDLHDAIDSAVEAAVVDRDAVESALQDIRNAIGELGNAAQAIEDAIDT